VSKVRGMVDKPDQAQPTQRTPGGLEIPVPAREAVMKDFRKVFKPDSTSDEPPRSLVGRARLRLKNPLGASKDR
jgi:hypothetical protein